MKLLRVDVEHFACIRKASVDLGPGLNVLFGPNDLGKSTLARAIRAAFLIQHTSSAANEFVEWESGEHPSVKLTLELPDRRIWRVEKRFGSSGGSAILRTSTDGKTFSPYKKAREVDDEVRTRLGWGIASPATKGAPRGLPTSFLATVLLGEQTDVASVLRQTLAADSDESGRARLTRALAAFAQDPLFKSILEEAQAKVDLAFTTTGSKKRGKTSPFRDATDEVKRVQEELEQLDKRVADSDNARRELEVCNRELLRCQQARQQALETRDSLRAARADLAARKEIEQELASASEALAAQELEVAELGKKEAALVETKNSVEQASQERESAASEKEILLAREKAAEEALRRATSDEAEKERQLRRSELQHQKLELDSRSRVLGEEQEKAAKARALHTKLDAAKEQATKLAETRTESDEAATAAAAAKLQVERRLELVEVADLVSQQRRAQASIADLERVRAVVEADRARADELRAGARQIIAGLRSDLPERAAVDAMQTLAHDLEVAEAKLGGGLAVVVERLQAVALEGTADGVEADLATAGNLSFEARRGFVLQIGDVAKVSVTAGERAAREREAALRRRWDLEVAPVLARLGFSDLTKLAASVEQAAALRDEAAQAESAARALEERSTVPAERLTKLAAHQQELAAIARELAAKPGEEAAKMLDDLGDKPLHAYRGELKREQTAAQDRHDVAQTRARETDTELQVLAERIDATRKELAELGIAAPPAGWDGFAAQLAERTEKVVARQREIAAEIVSLVAEKDTAAEQAEAALAALRQQLAASASRLAQASQELAALRDQTSRLEGEIENRRAAVAKLDVAAAQKQVAEIAARLATLPPPARPVSDDEMREAEQKVEEAERAQERAKDDVRKAEGVLQTVGGQVVIDQRDAAREALDQAEQKEREVELEYDAWRLLVQKLRAAENTEGQHLGEALSQPVSDRFARLTAGRYGKIEVGANLETAGLQVAGVLRDVSALSVGTQEQLATLLRLTVAEQLGTTLVLDDHLTQTDPARSAWFRDVLREHGSKAQVIVLTCRPLDYLLEEDLPVAGEVAAIKAAGIVRSIDLSKVIVRGGGAAPGGARLAADGRPYPR